MEKHTHVFRLGNGSEVNGWVAQDSSVMLKAVSKTDPVELTANEAREIARWLLEAADAVDADK